MPRLFLSILLVCLPAAMCLAQEKPIVSNPGFEIARATTANASGWTFADPPRVPEGWTPNSHYVGHMEILSDGAQEGRQYLRLKRLNPTLPAHLYQPLPALQPGKWYRVSLWTRGDAGEVSFYEYRKTGPMTGTLLGNPRGGSDWHRFVAYYHVPAENFASASLALATSSETGMDVDNVLVELLTLPETPETAPPVVFENDLLRFGVSQRGQLAEFTCKPLRKSYLGPPSPLPILTLQRPGVTVPCHSVTRTGNDLKFLFVDPETTATLRITPRKQHFLIEVVDVQPADVQELTLAFPVKRLATIGGAFGATYDSEFGACCFCASINSRNRCYSQPDAFVMGGSATRAHGLLGARFVLIGSPAAQFRQSVIQSEKENGLPCPIIGGKWARDSESNRKSYLFAVSVDESHIDKLIQYARTGGFGTIIFGMGDWIENHGHFDIHTKKFPGGTKKMRQIVDKIHAAGFEAGVHVFGPSISPNDPYITPVPSPDLAETPCSPLAEAVDEKAATLTLTGDANLPPKTASTRAGPGRYLQIGDEIIQYNDAQIGPPWRFTGCRRGALGTTAAAHPAGSKVKALLTLWGFFVVKPDSQLAEDVTSNFARVFNACNFDFAYFDASDGLLDIYIDRWYYLNKMHMGYFMKIGRGIIYQTSNGTGSDLTWHMVPRSASADGHGDIKGYLDDRWPGILGMGNNWTKADIGWYYWFRDVRPDQIEYVCSKALGIDGSISLETSVEATERLAQSRQMYEMIGRWERCRRANVFGEAVRERLREKQQDFKVFQNAKGGWDLYRAAYEAPRILDQLNGQDNTFTINNPLDRPCTLGFELVRMGKGIVAADYDDPAGKTVEAFNSADAYLATPQNRFEQFVIGDRKVVLANGVVRDGVKFEMNTVPQARIGDSALRMAASNSANEYGWTGIGRRFDTPLDLRGFQGAGMWIRGDGSGVTIRVQLRDTAGRSTDFLPVMNYEGWRLHIFPLPQVAFDWSKVAYLLLYFNGLGPGKSAEVVVDDLRMLPKVSEPQNEGQPVLEINGRRVVLPVQIATNTAISHEGVGGVKFWPGGFTPGVAVPVPPAQLQLKPGANQVTFSWTKPELFPGSLQVLLYRVWPFDGRD